MFSKDIVDNDKFYDLPLTSQLLYFHLGLQADDDGFIYPKSVARKAGLKIEDLKPLIEEGFVIPFSTGVVVITDWKRHNYIRKDTYTETQFKDEMKALNLGLNDQYILGPSTDRQRLVHEPSPQDRLGKDRLGKDREREEAPEKTTNSLRLTKNQITVFCKEYPNLTRDEVREQAGKCNDYMAVSSNDYSNPGLFFRGWLKRYSKEKAVRQVKETNELALKRKLEASSLSEEELVENLRKMEEIRKKVFKQ